MTIAGSERRWSIPLFYRRAHPVAHRGNDLYFVEAEELVGADRVFGDSRADEHLLHGLDQPRRAGDVVDVGGEALQVALEHGAVQKPGLAAPGTARLVHFDHRADEMAAGMALGERRELLEKGRILGPAVGIQQPQVAPEPRVRCIAQHAHERRDADAAREKHGRPGVGGIQREHARRTAQADAVRRSEEHTSELQSPYDLVCRLLLEKKKKKKKKNNK